MGTLSPSTAKKDSASSRRKAAARTCSCTSPRSSAPECAAWSRDRRSPSTSKPIARTASRRRPICRRRKVSRRYRKPGIRAGLLLAIRCSGSYFRRGHAQGRRNKNMARKPGTRASGEFVLFNVIYEDGTQRSNRKVPAELLGGLDGDAPARAVIEQQDRDIAAKSGMAPLTIKSMRRADAKDKEGAKAWKVNAR